MRTQIATIEYENPEFSPDAFNPDYFLLYLKVVAIEKDRFKIISHEEQCSIRYIPKGDYWKFLLWEEYILSVFALESKLEGYKIYESGDPSSRVIRNAENKEHLVFSPLKISGEWLEVEWEEPRGATMNGWIRCRRGSDLLVNVFHYA